MRNLVLITIVLASCTDSSPSAQSQLTDAQRVWLDRALPVMEVNCVQCHAAEDPSFLSGEGAWAIRESLLASGLVDVDAPTQSRLLTKGAHSGPSLTARQTSDLLEWLVAETQ